MYANDEQLLRKTIEDADPPTFRQTASRTPEKIIVPVPVLALVLRFGFCPAGPVD